MPSAPKSGPNVPLRPNASSSASPATAGGTTIGRSTTASTSERPGKSARARTYASGVPSSSVMASELNVVTMLSRSARCAAAVCRAAMRSPGCEMEEQTGQREDDERDEDRGRNARPPCVSRAVSFANVTVSTASGRRPARAFEQRTVRETREPLVFGPDRGCDVMAACDLPKVDARVRFPPPAPGPLRIGDIAKW